MNHEYEVLTNQYNITIKHAYFVNDNVTIKIRKVIFCPISLTLRKIIHILITMTIFNEHQTLVY